MNDSNNIKKLFGNWQLYAVLVCIALVLLGANVRTGKKIINSVHIHIDDEKGNRFVQEEDVHAYLGNTNNALMSSELDQINPGKMEDSIEHDVYVEDAEIWYDMQGRLHAEVSQKRPVLRVINSNGVSYYIDEKACKLPLSAKFTPRVVVASGYIYDNMMDTGALETAVVKQLFSLTQRILSDEFWEAQIQQVYVNQNEEIELIPRLGNHNVIIGDTTNLDDKLDKLMLFYKDGLKTEGWSKYKTINLMFENQIVCTKW